MKAGWRVVPLGEACQFVATGPFGSLLGTKDYTEDGVPVINPADINTGEISCSTAKKVSYETAAQLATYRMNSGDVVVARRGELGRCAVVTEQHGNPVCGTGSFFVRPKETALADYLALFIGSQHTKAFFEKASTGATMPNISNTTLSSLPIPLPPLDEQKRIVAVLDEAFEGLSRARANAEANLADARELFERRLAAYFRSPHSDWRTCKLSEVTTKVGSGATPTGGAGSYKAEGVPLIRSLNVHDRRFMRKDLAFLDDRQADKLRNVDVVEGDVLLNITGASIARCCLAPPAYLPARVNQHVSIIRCDYTVLRPEYLMFMLTSEPYKTFLLKTGEDNGSTRQALTKALILDLQVSFPVDLGEQDRVIAQLRTAEREANDLASTFKSKITELDALRQSLLQVAFAGELT